MNAEYPSNAGRYPAAAAEAELEAIYRLDAIRPIVDAVLEGRWALDPAVLDGLARVLQAAASWARRAEEVAAAA